MARVYIDWTQTKKILKKYKVKEEKYGNYRFISKRIYQRIDGKFIAIGWHIFNTPYSHQTYSIVVTDSELELV